MGCWRIAPGWCWFVSLKIHRVNNFLCRRQALGVSTQTESLVACVAFAKKLRRLPLTLKLELLISGFPALECQCVLALSRCVYFQKWPQKRRPDIASFINLYGSKVALNGLSNVYTYNVALGTREEKVLAYVQWMHLDWFHINFGRPWGKSRENILKLGITRGRCLAVWPRLRC